MEYSDFSFDFPVEPRYTTMAASSTRRRFGYRKAEYEYESGKFRSKAFRGRRGVAVSRGWSVRATSAPAHQQTLSYARTAPAPRSLLGSDLLESHLETLARHARILHWLWVVTTTPTASSLASEAPFRRQYK